MPIIADSFSFGDFVLWVLYVFALVVFFWMLFVVLTDLFARHDVSGGAKALWVVFVVFFPFLGILVYLVTQGEGMAKRAQKVREMQLDAARHAAGFSAADELAKLKKLHDDGVLSAEEFERAKHRIIGEPAAS